MQSRGEAPARILTIALALLCWTAQGRAAPLGFPIPSKLEPGDVLSTSNESGDIETLIPGAKTCDSAPHRAISLPADDAPHDDSWIEWWWWHGHIAAPDGRRFGFLLFFASKPTAHFYAVDYAITDLSTGKFHYGRHPFIPGRPEATTAGFRLRDDHAVAVGGGGRDELHFDVDGYELDLSLESSRPAVMEFGDGYIQSHCNDLYMFSRTRMSVVGTLRHAGASIPVDGTATYNKQWGFNPALEIVGWDWFTFELDDGRDILMVAASLRKNGEEFSGRFGSISDADGNVTTLHRGDFTFTPTRFWQRDAICAYPVEWDVQIPGLRFHARAALDTTELRGTRWPAVYALWPTWPLFWNGPAVVSGDATGRGWFDLGHYCEF
jgi:predicted secreted hydrolase